MSEFKDLIKSDADIFINNDEFAEEHEFNGQNIKCVVDDFSSVPSFFKSNANFEGLLGRAIKIYVKKDDLLEVPANNVEITFDNKPYMVKSSLDNMGIVEITIEGSEFCL